MKPLFKVALVVICLMVLAGSCVAEAATLREKYQARYDRAKRRGLDPGLNLIEDGVKARGGWRAAGNRRIARSARVMLRWLTPAGPVVVRTRVHSMTAPAVGLPACTWRPESGGDYGAVNPSSGARGKYQVIPSTHAAYCSDLGWSPGDQDACAARVYEGQGAGAWTNC